MNITLPVEIESRFSPSEVTLHLAVGLFVDKEVTLGQGAAIAGCSTPQFLAELGKRRIPIHYDVEDAVEDIQTVAGMSDT